MADLYTFLIFTISVLLIALCLYIADKLVGTKPYKLTSGYYIKAIITAIIIIVLIIAVGVVLGYVGILGIDRIATILAFVLSCYAIKILLMDTNDYEKAVWVGVITWILIYVINYLSTELIDEPIILFID